MVRRVATLALLGLAGCGGSSTLVASPGGDFDVDVPRASFGAAQRIAASSDLVLRVRNTGEKALPQLTVTVWTGDGDVREAKSRGSFSTLIDGRTEPVWLLTQGYPKVDGKPSGGGASLTDSYVFGGLPAGASRTLVWRVAPVRAGSFRLNYAIAAGTGAARAVGDGVDGSFRVRVSPKPAG